MYSTIGTVFTVVLLKHNTCILNTSINLKLINELTPLLLNRSQKAKSVSFFLQNQPPSPSNYNRGFMKPIPQISITITNKYVRPHIEDASNKINGV